MTNAVQAFSKAVDPELVEPLRNVVLGRKLVSTTEPKGFGISSIDWGKIVEMGPGKVSFGFTDGNADAIDVSLSNSKVPVYWKDYILPRRIYESWKLNNTDIDLAASLSAAYQAAAVEDAAILMGVTNDGSNYDIPGLYQAATSLCDTTAGSADFGTYGNAKATVAAAKRELVEANVPAYNIPLNLLLASTQYGQLESSESTNGVEELPKITKMLNGGSVYSIPETIYTAGTGLLLPAPSVGRAYVDFFLTQDFETEHGIDAKHPKTGNLNGRVYSAGVLRVKQPTALCRITNI